MERSDPLIEVEELEALLNSKAKNVRIIDSCYYPPKDPRQPEADYCKEAIPGAIFFPIDKVADTSSPYPHMMPSNETFIEYTKKYRIRKEDLIVCYDHLGCFGSPRAWYTFLAFGATNVKVLNGGLPAWKNNGNSVTCGGSPNLTDGLDEDKEDSYSYQLDTTKIMNLKDIYELVNNMHKRATTRTLIDARSMERFTGKVDEPRAGLRKGNIPYSICIPFGEVLDSKTNKMRPKEELEEVFIKHGVDIKKPVTATCGSGLTACILLLALYRLGAKEFALYDGSWSEYGALPEPKWEFAISQ